MQGSERWGHVLNTELAYVSTSQLRILSIFSGTAGNGRHLGLFGTDVLMGHVHEALSSLGLVQPEDSDLKSKQISLILLVS